MRRIASLALVVVSGVALAGSLPAVSASSLSAPAPVAAKVAAASPQQGAAFNVPAPWGSKEQQNAILIQVDQAINRAQGPTKAYPDPTITISTYLLDRTSAVTALIQACRRGIGIRVVLDHDIINHSSRRLISAFNGDNPNAKGKTRTGRCGNPKKKGKAVNGRVVAQSPLMTTRQARLSLDVPTGASKTWGKDKSYVKRCHGSCRNAGNGGNMHSKFYLFSRTGADRNVVMVSSSNLNRGGASSGWNEMYVMRNRPKTYDAYLRLHRAMSRELRSEKLREEIIDGPFTNRFFPIRNGGKSSDPTLDDLKRIKCTSDLGRTEINISMFYWAGSRGTYLTNQVLALARAGCRVSVIVGAPSRAMATRLRAAATSHLISLYDSRWDMNDDDYNEVRTHAKYVLVKGTYRGDRSAHVVMTGSQNWVSGSLSLGDETTTNIALKSAYTAYKRNWDNIRSHSRRIPATR